MKEKAKKYGTGDGLTVEQPNPVEEELALLRQALEWCVQHIWDGYTEIDLGDLQDHLTDLELLVEVPATPEFLAEWGPDAPMLALAWKKHFPASE